MCLYLDDHCTKKIQKRLQKHGKIRCYKIINREWRSQYRIEKLNWNKIGFHGSSRRRRTKLTAWEKKHNQVHKGIHVYLKKPHNNESNYIFILPVYGYLEDFVAAGQRNQAVFTCVEVGERDLKIIRKQKCSLSLN